jgi:hypothetical protein
VDITIDSEQFGFDKADEVGKLLRTRRPDAAGWLHGSVSSTRLEVFGAAPAYRLAMKWLAGDLSRVHWTDRWSVPH